MPLACHIGASYRYLRFECIDGSQRVQHCSRGSEIEVNLLAHFRLSALDHPRPTRNARPVPAAVPTDTHLLHRGELSRRQELVRHLRIDRAVRFALRSRLLPVRIHEEGTPLLLAVGHRFPGQHVREIVGIGAYQCSPSMRVDVSNGHA